MTKSHRVVFLLDVDNTLLDNDRVIADLMRHLEQEVGHERRHRYWEIFEELRDQLGYGDYLARGSRSRIRISGELSDSWSPREAAVSLRLARG